MRTTFMDLETRSIVNLRASGADVYSKNPSTQPLGGVFAIDFDEPQLWRGEPAPEPVPPLCFAMAAEPTQYRLISHGPFDRLIWDHVLVPRYGFPPLPAEIWHCSMTLALFNARPAELGLLVESLGLPYSKDPAAKRAMLQVTRPRQSRKRKPDTVPVWDEDPAKLQLLYERCRTDVLAMRAVWFSNRLRPLPESEHTLWQLDRTINQRGIRADRTFVEAARALAVEERTRINFALADLTDGQITTANQVQRFLKLVNERGHRMTTLNKRSVAAVLAHKPDDFVEQLLRLRQAGARASVRKFDAMLAHASPGDDRLRGCFRFYGSHTGRWSGQNPQLQNLKKNEANLPLALVDDVRRGEREELAKYGRPLELLGDLSRAALCAAPGHELKAGDFSAIESRVLAWLAGEQWKLEAYRHYDASGDKSQEPYKVLARRMLQLPDDAPVSKDQRQLGKGAELALSFAGSVGAWRKIFHHERRSDTELLTIVRQYRAANPATVAFWHALARSIRLAIKNPGQQVLVPNERRPGEPGPVIKAVFDGDLLLTLPSRRTLIYPDARLVPGKFEDGPADVEYSDNAKGQWRRRQCWHGVFVENVTQAVARDILVAAMVRVAARGLNIVATCHDEITIEVPIGAIGDVDYLALLIEPPAWAEGLPLNGHVHSGSHYLEPPETPALPLADREPEPDAVIEQAVDAVVAGEELGEIDDPALMEREDDRDYVDNLAINVAPLYELTSLPLAPGNKVSCPFHTPDDDPSCQLYADHYHCHACGAHGDRLQWLKDAEGLTEPEAIATIKAWQDVPADGPRRDIEEDTASKIARALRLWEEAQPIAGSPAAKYLDATRGVDLTGLPADVHASLRFHPSCVFGSDKLPCLLALMREPMTEEPTGIQRIALGLGLDGRVDKVERRMLGRAGVVMLWPAASTLVVGEGLETTLAAATRIPYRDGSLTPAWSCLSAHRLGSLPVLSGVERLIILVDHDAEGRKAADRVGATWRAAGRQVTTLMPPEPGTDFNDFILRTESNHANVA